MPRRIASAAAGWNLLFGPPGSPAPPFGGRGSIGARATTISNLGLAALAEMLFEGGDGVDNVAFDEIRGNGVAADNGTGVIVHGGDQFSFHSVDSIQFNKVDQNFVRVFSAIPTFYVFELWFRDTLTDGGNSQIVTRENNDNEILGRKANVGFNWPAARNEFAGIQRWEPEIDLSSDGLIHQLLEIRDTVGGTDLLICFDGMPVATLATSGSLSVDMGGLPSFNGNSGTSAANRFGGEMGSFVAFDDGSNLTLKDARELYETSCLDGRDILTSPRWFVLDSSNVVIPDPILAKQVDLGDVSNDTGIRSGAIPRSKVSGGAAKTYFELEIIEQGDDATATLIGLRRFAEGGPVGGDPDNPDEAIYLKDGKLYDGANVILLESAAVGIESGAILDGAMTAKSSQGSFLPEEGRLNNTNAWAQAAPPDQDDWLQVDLGSIKSIGQVQTQGAPAFSEWVITYELEYSDDGIEPFTSYNSNEVLDGNTGNGPTVVTNFLIPFSARYIRLIPKSWNSFPEIRIEYIAVGDQDDSTLADPVTGQIYRFAMEWPATNPTQFFIGDDLRWKGTVGLPNPAAGLESGAILDGALTADNFLDANHSPFHARLNNADPNYWHPSASTGGSWWKIDFGSLRDIAAISTQGATDDAARVNQYKLEYNDDGGDIWTPYNGGETLNGNVSDATTVITNQLIPFTCRFLRVRPTAWITNIALRVEFFYDEQANPSQDRAGLGFLVTNFNWGAWLRTNGTSGNGKVRLRTKFYEMIFPLPTDYDSWEPQIYTVEVLPQGVNRRQSVFDFYPALEVTRYVFEDAGSDYLLDTNDKKLTKAIVRNLSDGAGTDPTHAGLQLSHVSIDSIRWPRTINADATQPSQDNDVHAFELWFRQPDFSQTECCLFNATNNSRVGVGRGNGGSNFPALVNNFNAVTEWESEIDFYGDNKPHQLFIAHSSDTDYVVYIDGMPVARETNTGWLDNARRYIFNGEQSNGVDQGSRSGGDFGSLTEYKGGERFTQLNVRKLFEASALNGHQMLTNPQWFILDSEHTTLIGGDPTKAKMDDVVSGQAGINSGAIPRNGKVYFELLFILEGDNQFGCMPGIRLLNVDADVFGTLPLQTDGYHLEQSVIRDGHGIRFPDQFVTNNANIFPPRTGEYYQFAIDWDTGDWWVGHENTWIGGGIVSNTANPSTGAFPLGVNSPEGVAPLDIEKDYCVNIRKLATFGNSETQLITASADFSETIPTGFTAWDDAL